MENQPVKLAKQSKKSFEQLRGDNFITFFEQEYGNQSKIVKEQIRWMLQESCELAEKVETVPENYRESTWVVLDGSQERVLIPNEYLQVVDE